jgi:hypothetical protein
MTGPAKPYVSGKTIQPLGLPKGAKLHAKRSMKTLKQSGSIPDDEMEVLDRFVALSAKKGSKGIVDVAAIAELRADQSRLKAFAPHELVLLSRTMKRLEYVEPERAEALPPLPPLSSEIKDVSEVPGGAINTRVPISEEHFKPEQLKTLLRLQRVHDDDGEAGTVSVADLKAGAKDTRVFTQTERKVFGRARTHLEKLAQATTTSAARHSRGPPDSNSRLNGTRLTGKRPKRETTPPRRPH